MECQNKGGMGGKGEMRSYLQKWKVTNPTNVYFKAGRRGRLRR